MAQTLPAHVADRPRKQLAARLDRGEVTRKNFAGDEMARVIDAIVRHSKLTDQQFAFALGYHDQSQLSRWRNGLENASALFKIWGVVALRAAVVKALAERANHPDVRNRHVVEIA